jgi:hypothetical protein
MDRVAALAYIAGEFTTLATEADVTVTDTSAGFKTAIDTALRELGYSESDLASADVPTSLTNDYVKLLDYYALVKLARSLAIYADVRVDAPTVEKKKSQIYANVMKLLGLAKADIETLGYGLAEYTSGFINFDYLEPRRM